MSNFRLVTETQFCSFIPLFALTLALRAASWILDGPPSKKRCFDLLLNLSAVGRPLFHILFHCYCSTCCPTVVISSILSFHICLFEPQRQLGNDDSARTISQWLIIRRQPPQFLPISYSFRGMSNSHVRPQRKSILYESYGV